MAKTYFVLDCGDGTEHVISLEDIVSMYTTRHNGDKVYCVVVLEAFECHTHEVNVVCYDTLKAKLLA